MTSLYRQRWPWENLEAYIDAIFEPFDPDVLGSRSPISQFADRVGVSSNTAYQWRKKGWLSDRAADRVATALQIHPLQIWPDWFDVDCINNMKGDADDGVLLRAG